MVLLLLLFFVCRVLWDDVLRYFRILSICLLYSVELGGGEKGQERGEGKKKVKGLESGKE